MHRDSHVTPSTASEWAAHVSRRSYRRSRHVLDELIINTVPAYAAIVDEELGRFERGAMKTRVNLDAPYQAMWSIRPAVDRLVGVLSAVVLVSVAISVGLTFAGPGRTGVSIPVEWRPWMMTLSSICLTVAAVSQPLRWLPYARHIPPRDGLAWVIPGFGIPIVALMFWLYQQDIGIPQAAVVIAFVGLIVSSCACVARLMRRLRDPRRTKKVDQAAKGRRKAIRTAVVSLADASAKRLVEKFTSLPENDQACLRDELNRAAAQLEKRGLATASRTGEARTAKDRRNRRGMFPGLLLLSHRVEAVNTRINATAQWIVGDFVEDPMDPRLLGAA